MEADQLGVLTISEAELAAVPELVVTTRANRPILLVEGETVAGGLQHRTLNVTVLAPAPARIALPVTCVEAGRWGERTASRRAGRHTPLDLRGASTKVTRSEAVGLGRELSAQTDALTLTGLELDGPPVHLAAFAA